MFPCTEFFFFHLEFLVNLRFGGLARSLSRVRGNPDQVFFLY